jgi:hypothetical protein
LSSRRAGIVAEDKGPLRLDGPHDKALLGRWRLGEGVADLDLLKLGEMKSAPRPPTTAVRVMRSTRATAGIPHRRMRRRC